jgi:hypothetical protein
MDKQILRVIADNPALFDCLKNHILDEFEVETPQADLGVTDEVLGQIFRARLVGKNKVQSAFKKVLTYKSVEITEDKINMAR